jgi:hypothetical protein
MNDKQKQLSVSNVFLAAFSGAFVALGIFEALKEHREVIRQISPIWIFVAVGAFVLWGVIKLEIDGRNLKKELRRKEAEIAKSEGYQSYAEYMAAQATFEDIRESWKPLADKERAKRAKRKW